jgi:hypothetical protein
VRAVVSVSMLKEGWDVKNIYVIASVRSMESSLLTEQILGRGLRLPFGQRTGNPMLDTVEVLSHRSFASLLKQAKSLLEQTLGDRVDERVRRRQPGGGRRAVGTASAEQGDVPGGLPVPGRRGRSRSTARRGCHRTPTRTACSTRTTVDGAGARHTGFTHGRRWMPRGCGGGVGRRRCGDVLEAADAGWGEDPAVPAVGGDAVGAGPVHAGVDQPRLGRGARAAPSRRTTRRR